MKKELNKQKGERRKKRGGLDTDTRNYPLTTVGTARGPSQWDDVNTRPCSWLCPFGL